eukprot:1165614_1
MEHLVKFRLMSDTLTTLEFHTFITTLLNQYSKELFQSMILSHFHSQLYTLPSFNESEATIHDTNSIISEILQSRQRPLNNQTQDHPRDDDTPEPIRLDSDSVLPMIGEIGSYLLLSEYTHFSLSNQSVFVASQTPFKLHRLRHLDKYIHHCNTTKRIIDLNTFKMIKELHIDNGIPKYNNDGLLMILMLQYFKTLILFMLRTNESCTQIIL